MADRPTLRILSLYPNDMNIYGDTGNILALKHRIEQHGYGVELLSYNVGDVFPSEIDMIIGGGGQDSGQNRIQDDLQKISSTLKTLAVDDMPMLMICGLYQLFGHEFITANDERIAGVGIFDITTTASNKRLIGNITVTNTEFGEIIGFENHSGLTILGKNATPLANVIKGAGNNGDDKTEGARYRNIIGSYMHGPLLPKNPRLADWLIAKAAERSFGTFHPRAIDDTLIEHAREIARSRPR